MAEQQDGTDNAPGKTTDGGESEGGAYPNPHTGHPHKTGGFFGHGGQSDIDYSGPGDAGDGGANDNAVTEGE